KRYYLRCHRHRIRCFRGVGCQRTHRKRPESSYARTRKTVGAHYGLRKCHEGTLGEKVQRSLNRKAKGNASVPIPRLSLQRDDQKILDDRYIADLQKYKAIRVAPNG